MDAIGKGPHFLQKNPPTEFSGYRPGDSDNRGSTVYANTTSTICLRQKFFTNAVSCSTNFDDACIIVNI